MRKNQKFLIVCVFTFLGSFSLAKEKKLDKKSLKGQEQPYYISTGGLVVVKDGVAEVEFIDAQSEEGLNKIDMSKATFLSDNKSYSATLKSKPVRTRNRHCRDENDCSEDIDKVTRYVYKFSEKEIPISFSLVIFNNASIEKVQELARENLYISALSFFKSWTVNNWIAQYPESIQTEAGLFSIDKSGHLNAKLESTNPDKPKSQRSIKSSFDIDISSCQFSKYGSFKVAKCDLAGEIKVVGRDSRRSPFIFVTDGDAPLTFRVNEGFAPALTFSMNGDEFFYWRAGSEYAFSGIYRKSKSTWKSDIKFFESGPM